MEKKKIKIDRYLINEKGKTYEILKFPRIKYMWAYDAHPAEECLMVNGGREAYEWLLYASAILADYKDKIIYFPIRQSGKEDCYLESYDLVLCRFGLQFRRSLWPKIKGKLNQKHYAGKFVLHYDRKKLGDYYDKGLWTKYGLEEEPKQRRKQESMWDQFRKAYRRMIQETQGDTMFWVMDRIIWYGLCYEIAYDLDDFDSQIYPVSYSLGLIFQEWRLEALYG